MSDMSYPDIEVALFAKISRQLEQEYRNPKKAFHGQIARSHG